MNIRAITVLLSALPLLCFGEDKESTAKDRELIEAVYRLRIADVVRLLAEGANVNARYGEHKADQVFQDPWSLVHRSLSECAFGIGKIELTE